MASDDVVSCKIYELHRSGKHEGRCEGSVKVGEKMNNAFSCMLELYRARCFVVPTHLMM
jgi:hypothetical protein